MDKTINLECARSSESDELQLRWSWDPKVHCYAVVKMHTLPYYIDKTDKDSICEYINDEKHIDSRIKCYQLEYAKKSAFIYRLNDSDIGYLSFCVYPCSEDGNTILTDCDCNTVTVLGKIHEVSYSVLYDDSFVMDNIPERYSPGNVPRPEIPLLWLLAKMKIVPSKGII